MYRIPKHIGIIPDGNRRWAAGQGLNKEDGYAYGLDSGLRLLRAARDIGVEELTYYGFTADNCKRPKEQVRAFSDACVEAVRIMEREGAAVRVVGNTASACFPSELLPYIQRRGEGIKVNLLAGYGWEWDIKNGWLTRDIPRVDLIIRWGGMCRLSGFLPLQSVYADFYIVKALWPDFEERHFADAIEWYKKQDVTLGG